MDRQLLLNKKEAVYGTDPGPAAVDTLMAEAVRFALKGTDVGSDPSKPGVGATPSFTYGQHVELSFEVALASSGEPGVAPKWGALLKQAGFKETIVEATSVTYELLDDPSSSDSGTFVWRDAKRLHKITGARGRVGLKATAGQRPTLTLAFKGLYTPVAAGAALVGADADFDDWNEAQPIAQGRTTFSFGGVNMPLRELTAEPTDNVVFVDLPHQENVQLLGERAFTGKIKATMPEVGTYNPEAAWSSRERQAFVLGHETEAGKVVTITGQGQVGEPSYSRDNGADVFEQSLKLLGSDLAASDDLVIVLT
ncbi:hypothetical protein D3C80_126900 [compost metagenome]